MKTIEERAEEYADKTDLRESCHYVIKMAHIAGATEQKAIDIHKAIKAHCKVCMAYNACTERGSFVCPQTERIKKTMEE